MIVALDVDYRAEHAVVAAVAFADWSDAAPAITWTAVARDIAPYRSGHFYERELPPLLTALSAATIPISMVVIDGYVWLACDQPGLGKHVFDALRVPIVGVAKRARASNDVALPVVRGESRRPLWVTAEGISEHAAATLVKAMHGDFRLPTLLKLADSLARTTMI